MSSTSMEMALEIVRLVCEARCKGATREEDVCGITQSRAIYVGLCSTGTTPGKRHCFSLIFERLRPAANGTMNVISVRREDHRKSMLCMLR